MAQNAHSEIRTLSFEEIDGVSGGTVTDTIINAAKAIAETVSPPVTPIDPPTIPQIGGAIAGVGRFLGSIF